MKALLAVFLSLFALPAMASTYEFELQFTGDHVTELHSGFDVCFAGQPCYPADFRLPNGYFAGLEPGELTKAKLDLTTGTANIGDWSVPGDLMASPSLARFLMFNPTGTVDFTYDHVTMVSEGPRGFNAIGYCDPDTSSANLPDGFCGFFGYEAQFDVLTITKVPLPAGAALLLTALALAYGVRRRRT